MPVINGLLVDDPQQAAANTQQQMQQGQVRAAAPGFIGYTPPPQQGQAQQMPGIGAGNINEIYGILAQGADDPTQVGMSYIRAMQNQQQLKQQTDPKEQMLRMIGQINPHTYDPASIQDVYDNFVKTGEFNMRLLKDRKSLSSQEEKRLFQSHDKLLKAQGQIGRAGALANQFMEAYKSGEYAQGLPGGIKKWFQENISGELGQYNELLQRFNQLRVENAIGNLPPGVASDRDIALALSGWPTDKTSPAYLAAFLRGVQKLEALSYARALHENNYISMNQNARFMSQDWTRKGNAYTFEALKANGLIPDQGTKRAGDYTAEELEAYAESTYGGGYQQPVNPGGGGSGTPGVTQLPGGGSMMTGNQSTKSIVRFLLDSENQ